MGSGLVKMSNQIWAFPVAIATQKRNNLQNLITHFDQTTAISLFNKLLKRFSR